MSLKSLSKITEYIKTKTHLHEALADKTKSFVLHYQLQIGLIHLPSVKWCTSIRHFK